MQTISLLAKTRRGVAINQIQLFDVDCIVGPIQAVNGGADSKFVYREGKRGPYSTSPGTSEIVEYVVDQTLAQIEALAINIFIANILTYDGRPKLGSPLTGFNANNVCGSIKPIDTGSLFYYQDDAGADLVPYTVSQTPAEILVQIQFATGGGGGTGDVTATGNLTPNHFPFATSSKNIADSNCTYIAGTVTIQGANANNYQTIGAGGVITTGTIIGLNSSGVLNLSGATGINIVGAGINPNTVLVTDGAQNIISSTITISQLNFINTVTSNVQTQLDGKLNGTLTTGYMTYGSAPKAVSSSSMWFDSVNSRFGFGTTSPSVLVHINGGFRLSGSSESNGYILTCDATGFATWQPAPTGFSNPMTTRGDIIQADTGGAATRLAAVATGNVLISGGAGAFNSWGKVGLTTHVTGVLPPANGGSGTATIMTPGSVLFAGASGIYSQDNANFFYSDANDSLLLGGASYNTAVLNVKSAGSRSGLHVDMSAVAGGYAAIIATHADPSTNYSTVGVGTTGGLFINTSTTTNTNSMIRFRNGSNDSAVVGTLYAGGASANFVIGVSKSAGDANHSSIYVIGATTAVGIGYDFKTPTATLHLIGATAAQSSFRIGNATAMPTGTNRYGGDINFQISTGRYYGYKADNTVEEPFAYLSDVSGGFVTTNGLTPMIADWYTGPNKIIINRVVIGGPSVGIYSDSVDTGFISFAMDTSFYGQSEGTGAYLDGTTIGVDARSINSAAIFTQIGVLPYDNIANCVTISREFTLNGQLATGSLLNVNDTTASTGDIATFSKLGVTKVAILSTGVIRYIDGNQAAGKVITSNANGDMIWQTPAAGFTNPMTTIGDIIQANTGGTPQRLGNSTTGTYLRSVSGGLNVWSTLVLPNAAGSGEVFFATAANVMGSAAEFRYVVSDSSLKLLKNVNSYLEYSVVNISSGSAAVAQLITSAGATTLYTGSTSSGYTGDFGASASYLSSLGGSGLCIRHDTAIKFHLGGLGAATDIARFANGGMMIGSAAGPDSSCILDLTSITRGFRIPRMTTTQKNSISTSGKPGIFVFDTTLDKPCYTNNAGTWVTLP